MHCILHCLQLEVFSCLIKCTKNEFFLMYNFEQIKLCYNIALLTSMVDIHRVDVTQRVSDIQSLDFLY